MISVVIGDQGALDGCADGPVVPDRSVEGQQALDDAGPQAGRDPAAVVLTQSQTSALIICAP